MRPLNKYPDKFEKDYMKCGKLLIKLKDLELMRMKVLEMKQVFPKVDIEASKIFKLVFVIIQIIHNTHKNLIVSLK